MTDRKLAEKRTPNGDAGRSRRLTAEQASQGQIVLTTRRRRLIFVSGLVALVFFPLVVALLS